MVIGIFNGWKLSSDKWLVLTACHLVLDYFIRKDHAIENGVLLYLDFSVVS